MERRGGFFYALGPHNARWQKDAREQADRSSCSQNKGGIEPDNLLCSRNARPQKALVGRAQWKINQPPSLRDNKRVGTGSSLVCKRCSALYRGRFQVPSATGDDARS